MAHPDTLIVEAGPGETRIAALANERVIELHHVRLGAVQADAVFRGRVQKRLSDADVLVDLGEGPPGFLAGRSLPPEGARVIVRVVQPARGEKGPKLAKAPMPDGTDQDGPIACLQSAPHPLTWCAGVYGNGLDRIVCDGANARDLVRTHVPSLIAITEVWRGEESLADAFGLDDALAAALDPVIALSSGGRLIIEPTAAFVAVDIDAGAGPAEAANQEAMPALADALRLRALAGPILVDLIPAKSRQTARLVDSLATAMADDPVPSEIAGLTPQGRIELVRRRMRPSLIDLLCAERAGPPHLDAEAIAYAALRRCVREAAICAAARLSLTVHADVAALLKQRLRPALDAAEQDIKMPITLNSRADGPRNRFDVETG